MSPNFKKNLGVFWNATKRGCTLAVAILIVFFAVMSIVTAAEGTSEQGMTFSSMLTISAFALLISYAKEIFRAEAIPAPARWLLNFITVGIGFFFVILRSGTIANTSGAFYVTGTVIYVLCYLAVFGVSALIKTIAKRNASPAAEEYVSRFSGE